MSNTIVEFDKKQMRSDIPQIKPGMKVRVHERIKEGNKERIQVFEGIVLAVKHGKGITATMTVRTVTSGVGVEKIYPLHSPKIEKVEIVRASKVRRAKLYFLRALSPKKIRRKLSIFKDIVAEEPKQEEVPVEEEKVEEVSEAPSEEKAPDQPNEEEVVEPEKEDSDKSENIEEAEPEEEKKEEETKE